MQKVREAYSDKLGDMINLNFAAGPKPPEKAAAGKKPPAAAPAKVK